MDHANHVALVKTGVDGSGPRWLELGAGRHAFTLALAELLGPVGEVTAVDRHKLALVGLRASVAERCPILRLLRAHPRRLGTHAPELVVTRAPSDPRPAGDPSGHLWTRHDRRSRSAAVRCVSAPESRFRQAIATFLPK